MTAGISLCSWGSIQENLSAGKPLEGQTAFIEELIDYYGAEDLSVVVDLLASIGDKTLMPRGISTVVKLFKGWTVGSHQFYQKNAIKLIQRAFYKYGRRIRSDQKLLTDFIFLLDQLTNFGYSEAYFIREDMITFKSES